MGSRLVLVLLGCSMIINMGCLSAPFQPPMGAISSVEAPLSLDHNKTLVSSKKGEASTACFFCLVSVGNASLQAAAENGQLKTINYVDYKYLNVLGIYQRTTVIAHGD